MGLKVCKKKKPVVWTRRTLADGENTVLKKDLDVLYIIYFQMYQIFFHPLQGHILGHISSVQSDKCSYSQVFSPLCSLLLRPLSPLPYVASLAPFQGMSGTVAMHGIQPGVSCSPTGPCEKYECQVG